MPANLKVVRRPLITEKNTGHLDGNTYVFEVEKTATKNDIAKAVERAFEVKVLDVRTMNCRGRERRMGRFVSKVPYFKKAFVKIPDGQKIRVFERV